MSQYLPRREVLKILGIHYQTLHNMVKRNEIELLKIGTKHYYNLDKYLQENGQKINHKKKKNICYCRVSSFKQKGDLDNQIKYMKEKYPSYEIIKDIGSGLNFNRTGLDKIIEMAISGEINELVIAHKDRLARFGYELIENIIRKYSNGKIVILNKEEEKTPYNEITKDILAIMNVYVAKINGLRKYKTDMISEIKKLK